VERTPAIPDLLYAIGLPSPNRSGGRGAVYVPGLPESAPKTNLPLERAYHTSGEAARGESQRKPASQLGLKPCGWRRANFCQRGLGGCQEGTVRDS
jgi:hypothetical protein